MDMSDPAHPRYKKSPCTKCGELCYHLCYISSGHSEKLVCVDCFGEACRKADENKKALESDDLGERE